MNPEQKLHTFMVRWERGGVIKREREREKVESMPINLHSGSLVEWQHLVGGEREEEEREREGKWT